MLNIESLLLPDNSIVISYTEHWSFQENVKLTVWGSRNVLANVLTILDSTMSRSLQMSNSIHHNICVFWVFENKLNEREGEQYYIP